jgi:hypothetical protein
VEANNEDFIDPVKEMHTSDKSTHFCFSFPFQNILAWGKKVLLRGGRNQPET